MTKFNCSMQKKKESFSKKSEAQGNALGGGLVLFDDLYYRSSRKVQDAIYVSDLGSLRPEDMRDNVTVDIVFSKEDLDRYKPLKEQCKLLSFEKGDSQGEWFINLPGCFVWGLKEGKSIGYDPEQMAFAGNDRDGYTLMDYKSARKMLQSMLGSK